ncbi:hypothetical protein [Streptomyces sp. NPDC000405]|uniref:hypothetical protein n=1 Tax=Streptomyces sp. NPDC000405 TaxID=3161033 RepID=UPI00398CD70F
MHPPSFPLYVWWTFNVVSTVVFLVFFVTLMPTRAYKIQVCVAPVMMMLFGVLAASGAPEMYPLYGTAVLALVLGVVGRRRELLKVIQGQENGEDAKPPAGLGIQLALSLIVMGGIGLWFSSTAW